jgi:radical SAM superfamily enzyme YgiQ (UPF0313 family)
MKGTQCMTRKILFIEPRPPDLHIFSTFAIPRLGSILLATIANKLGYECSVAVEDIKPVALTDLHAYDLVAISSITSTAPRAYAIADYCRKNNIPTIMGGPHPTFCPDEALEHADCAIRGEGEHAFPEFLRTINSNETFSSVPNLSYRHGSENIHNPIAGCIRTLDSLPHPDFSLINGGMKNINGGNIIPVQTSRGCPYDCTFCSVTAMFGRKYRKYSTDYIIEELLPHSVNPNNFVFFYDDHFTADRKRTTELLETMLHRNIRIKWSAQVRADVARDEHLVRLMKRAGCHTLFIGFESINPESLKNMHKKQTMEEIEHAIYMLKKYKIATHGMFVFGFDDDTQETCKATVRFARKRDIESVQFLILTPFPGTELHKQLERENRILFRDWGLYDAHHVTFQPKHFSPFDLQLMQIRAHKKYYSRLRLLRHLILFRVNQIVINLYAHRLNRVWKKLNKPYLKLINLIKHSKNFQITASIEHVVDIDATDNPGTVMNRNTKFIRNEG